MAHVGDLKRMFDAAEFCETVKTAVGEGRISSNLALRDGAAALAAVKCMQDFSNRASARIGPDVVAAYVSYSPGAAEVFTALRAISVNLELVSAALECLICIVRYSLDASRPQETLEKARSVVKEIVKSRAVLIYDILASEGKACAKKALTLLRLVATCHPMLVKELVNRFDLTAKSMAPSLCSITNNHCRVPFLDLMFVILASGERDVLQFLTGKGREVIVTCLRTIQERATIEANGGAGSSTKSIMWRQGKAHQNKKPKILPSHVQKRELVAAINFLLAIDKHLFKGATTPSRGAFAHPVPTLLAVLATLECPPLDVAPREVQPEQNALRSNARRMFFSLLKDSRISAQDDIVRAISNPSLNFGTKSVVSFVCKVVQNRPDLAAPLLQGGRMLSAPPALTLRWFGHFSVIAFCTLRLQKLITSFKDKQYFERCLSSSDPLIRHLGCTIALSFCKIVGRYMSSKEPADNYLPTLDALQQTAKPAKKDDHLFHRLITSYQCLFQKQEHRGIDVKQMIVSVDAAGHDIITAAKAIEGTLRTFPHSAVRKIVHKGYLSKLIVKASENSRNREALKLWRVCGLVLLSTDLFQRGTEDEIDVYLSVLSSLGKEAEPPAKAFEAIIAQALDMPYGLYDRLHSDEWSDESAPVKTSLMSVAMIIKLQKLEQSCSSNTASKSTQLVHRTLRKMAFSVVAMSSVLHSQEEPKSYLTFILPAFMKAEDIYWKSTRNKTEDADMKWTSRGIVEKMLHERGTYPKTRFLNLIERLTAFDLRVHTNEREYPSINAKSELGAAWDSWCDYRLPHRDDSRQQQSTEQPRLEKYALERGSFVFEGLFRLLLQAAYPGRIEPKAVENLEVLRETLTSSDYRFVACMNLRTAGSERTRRKLFEEVLARTSDEERGDKLHPEQAEFVYETVIRTIVESPKLAASEVKRVASFCFSILSRWDSIARWELHVAYSIAMMQALLTHSSIETSLRFKVFLASSVAERFPPIVEFTPRTTKSFLMLLEYSSCFREVAFAQVFQWSEKDFRNCNRVSLRLVSDAINSIGRRNTSRAYHKGLMERFLKASSKSKREWISIKLNEDDICSLRALESLACIIAGSRELCKLFLHRLVDKEMVATNSWVLLRLVLDSSDTSMNNGANITIQEYAKLFYFIRKHIGSVSESNEYPAMACIQVLGNVACLLRLTRASFHWMSVSSDRSLTLLCRNLTKCIESRFAMILSNSDQVEENFSSQSLAHLQYIASLLASQAEILKLDLSLEHAARETVISLLQNECQLLRYCLQTNFLTSRSFLCVTDIVIAFMLVIKASLPWLSSTKCDDDLARSLLAAHALLLSRSHEIASGRSERDSTIRECLRGLSNHISAGNLQQKVSLTTNRSLSAGSEPATVASGFPKFMLEEAAEYILKTSYHFTEPEESSQLRHSTKTLDPLFALNTFLCGCRQALVQPHAPILDLQHVTRGGLFALSVTGITSPDRELRILSFACLEAFTAVVGPVTGVPIGSASALYKDRRQLAFLLDLLRNSISDPLTPVLPLFAVWFRSTARIALTPNHAANKLVSTYLLRAPCMDVSDCYGLSYYFNCEAGGSELKAVRALAFDIVQKGVRSEKDVAMIRRRRVFDKIFMVSASNMGFDDTLRLAALRSLEAVIHRDNSLNITEELVGGYGIAAWVSSSAEHVGETMEEILIKLNILDGIAKSCIRRDYQSYLSVLAEALNLFIISRLRPTLPRKEAGRFTERIAKCGAQIAQMAPERRHIFRIDFSDLWIEYGSKTILSLEAKRDFVCCICKQRNTAVQPGVMEMLLEFTMHKDQRVDERVLQSEHEDSISPMVDMFVAECMLATENQPNVANFLTADFCKLLGAALYLRNSIWLLVAGVRALDLTDHLSEKIMACTDKIPAFVPQDIEPRFERQCHSIVNDMKLTIVEELVNLCDEIMNGRARDDQQVSSSKPHPISRQT